MTAAALVIVVLSAMAALAARLWRGLHMLQLEGYRVERYTRHAWERRSARDAVPALVALLTVGAGAAVSPLSEAAAGILVAAAAAAQAGYLAWSVWGRPSKKPLTFTARAGRILAVSVLLALADAAFTAWLVTALGLSGAGLLLAAYEYGALLAVVAPLVVAAAIVLLEPLEARLRAGFVAKARRRLDEVAPLVIGVAGSYGKTTTKNALVAALSESKRVMATPESYNTLLGVTRAINEQLTDDTQVLVVEMGARHPGDIEEICGLVRPTVGVVTRLGPQHLEYFRTEETVVRTKTELLRALPHDGLAVVDADGIAAFPPPHDWDARTVRVSVRPEADADVLVKDIAVSGEGTSFTLERREGGDFAASVRLLGRHAAVNSALAAVTALELGVEPAAVRDGLAAMAPVPHRLEIVRNDSVVVIDDAFNSNPEGFSAALEVLASFPGRRILITPGMIELGAETVPAHERIAREAAEACDAIILVGRTWPPQFVEALTAAGFPSSAITYAASLAEATTFLGGFIRAGDVVLFENDLPDNFA